MQAVRGGAAAGPGGELPPELGGLGVPGKGKQAGADEGAVDVEFVFGQRAAVRAFGDLRDVGGGVGCVEDPPAHHHEALSGLGGAGDVGGRGG
ncbi:hypothetical protein ACFZCU_39260 [Streptomyces canus]|uniref:hypothetical protein n=1 Tax=Streptomyces canus TaxID=58343 RepID=UPI0036ED5707